MDETMIIKIIFGSFLTIGSLVLFLLAFKLFYKYLIQEKRCTSKTKGIVKGYTLGSRGGENSGVFLPVIRYSINGKEYKVIGPEYKSYLIRTSSSPLTTESDMEFSEDEKQRLLVKYNVNSIISIHKNPMEKLYPKDSEVDVFYDPNNPKLAYVLRYCNRKSMFWLIFICGLAVLLTDISILLFL